MPQRGEVPGQGLGRGGYCDLLHCLGTCLVAARVDRKGAESAASTQDTTHTSPLLRSSMCGSRHLQGDTEIATATLLVLVLVTA